MTNEITKEQSQKITAEIKEAVNAILAAHGLESNQVKSTYGDWYEFKVTATVPKVNERGVDENTPMAIAYLQYGRSSYGLPDNALGVQFTANGETYTFVGIATRSHKYPIVGRNSKGENYKFPLSTAAKIAAAAALAG